MIQRKGYQSNRRVTPIRLSEGLNFTPVGSAGQDEDEDEKKKKEEGGLTGGQKSYLDALENSKQKAHQRAGFLFNKPDKPEIDEERRKRFQNLTKAGAISQLIDAVSDVALGANNQDYRPVPIAGDELAFTGMQQVYDMDEEHRRALKDYKDQVFSIDNQNKKIAHETDEANKQMRLQTDQFNKGIDLQREQARLGFESDNKALEVEKANAMREKVDEENKQYFDAGLRLISQGEEVAAMALLERSGLSVEDANALLGKNKEDSGGKTIISRLNNYLGYDGKDKTVTNLQLEMLKSYKELRKEIDEDGYDAHFNNMTGDPRTSKGRDFIRMEEELGPLRFVPDDMLVEDVFDPASGSAGPDGDKKARADWNWAEKGLVDPDTGVAEANKLDLPELGQVDVETEEGVNELAGYTERVVGMIDNAATNDEKRQIAERVERDLLNSNLTDEEIEQAVTLLFGGGEKLEDDAGPDVVTDMDSSVVSNDSTENTIKGKDFRGVGSDGSDEESEIPQSYEEFQTKVQEVRGEIDELESKGKGISLDEFKRLKKLKARQHYLNSNMPKKPAKANLPQSGALNFVGSNPWENVKTNASNFWKAINESAANLGQRTDEELYQEYLKNQ